MDSSCLPALLRVTAHVLALHDRVLTGDLDARAEVEALAALLDSGRPRAGGDCLTSVSVPGAGLIYIPE